MSNINLEIAFASSATPNGRNWPPPTIDTTRAWPPNTPNTPPFSVISMAYGYTSNSSGEWWDMFQNVPRVKIGDRMRFLLFDTSDMGSGPPPPLITISKIVIYVARYSSVDPTQPSSPATTPPFDSAWPSGSPYLIIDSRNATSYLGSNGLNGTPGGYSTGVNVQGRYWGTPAFNIGNPGYYEFTVGVYGSVNGSSKVFSVDPEMVVDG